MAGKIVNETGEVSVDATTELTLEVWKTIGAVLLYPWSNPPSSTTIDGTYAAYDGLGDGSAAGSYSFADILKVGSKSPKGDGKWGQADLSGNIYEWILDGYQSPYATPCSNCANVTNMSSRSVRGGSWSGAASDLLSSFRLSGVSPGEAGRGCVVCGVRVAKKAILSGNRRGIHCVAKAM